MNKLIVLFALLTSIQSYAQQDLGASHKVVFQMVSADSVSQQSLIGNLKNLRNAWPEAQVEIVFHGQSIDMVVAETSKFSKELEDFAMNKNIKMVVCENTMKKKKVQKAQLLSFIGTVPMGIGEIIMKQEQGWAYLKAGY